MHAFKIKYSDQKSKRTFPTTFLIKILFISIIIIWTFGFLYPILVNKQFDVTNYIFKRIYSPVCHQDHNKCITINSNEMLVCARCAGIYSGAFIVGLAALLFQFAPIKIKTLIILLVPLIVDVTFTTIGIYFYSKTIAFTTGLIFGSIVSLFLLNEIEDLFLNKKNKENE